jgi:hypothetical protein
MVTQCSNYMPPCAWVRFGWKHGAVCAPVSVNYSLLCIDHVESREVSGSTPHPPVSGILFEPALLLESSCQFLRRVLTGVASPPPPHRDSSRKIAHKFVRLGRLRTCFTCRSRVIDLCFETQMATHLQTILIFSKSGSWQLPDPPPPPVTYQLADFHIVVIWHRALNEDGSNLFLWNVGYYLPDYSVSEVVRSPLRNPEALCNEVSANMQKRDLDPAQSTGLPLGDSGSSSARCIPICPSVWV